VKVQWNPEGLYNVRRDPALVAQEDDYAEQVASRANANGKGTYEVGSRQGRKNPQGRWRTSVVTADAEAIADNARNNTLIRSM
jgi:hypothetical protein